MNVLVWFKRDLRVHDHPALALAASLGPVLPTYVVEPDYWRLPDTSARQWAFTAECLQDLRAALGERGAPLIVRVGDAVDVLARLCRQHGITRIVSHEETGNLWTFERDRRVAAWARNNAITWTELPQSGVVRRLAGRDGWSARRDSFVAAPQLPAPLALDAVAGVAPGDIPAARAMRLDADRCPHRQTGGRTQAMAALDGFLTVRGESYRTGMSSPLTAERVCSRLSPYLALGVLSAREASQATSARQATRPVGQWRGSLSSFQSRLAWRDHFIQKLEDEPEIEIRCLHRAAETLRPPLPDAALLAAWTTGETGIPFVDACMRYLRATGWLNFRMRSMLMAFASYQLWLDWRHTGPVLARLFTDYEPGIHWPQVQMQSGTSGINTIRMYNPLKQGRDQDPSGAFTRTWVPELAAVPDAFLQEPWKWAGAGTLLGHRYPEPVIDLAGATLSARSRVWGLRARPDFPAEAARIAHRHASRKDGTGRFVRDPALPRKPFANAAQLQFDF